MSPAKPPLRVLALHGFGQCASIFVEKRTKDLGRKLRGIAELVALDAPHFEPDAVDSRAWWGYPPQVWDGRPETVQALAETLLKTEEFEACGVEQSLELILEEWSKGDYDGILGFSQGAAMAAIFCAELASRQAAGGGAGAPGAPAPRLPRFAVLIAGFGRPWPRGLGAFPPKAPLAVPSLHVWGSQDTHIPGWTSELLAGYFAGARTHVHAGEHFVPQKAADCNAICDFLRQFQLGEDAPPQRPAPAAATSGSGGPAASAASAARVATWQVPSEELIAGLRRYARRRVGGVGSAPTASSPTASAPSSSIAPPSASASGRGGAGGVGGATDNSGLLPEELELPGPGTHLRLLALLRKAGVPFSELGPHPPCRTSEDAVRVRLEGGWQGVTLRSGAKAMLLRAGSKEETWLLAVLPADSKLSWRKVRALHGKATRMATEDEVREVTGCLAGAVPPLAAAFPKPVVCLADPTLLDTINFNCGLRTRSLQLKRADFERVQETVSADICE